MYCKDLVFCIVVTVVSLIGGLAKLLSLFVKKKNSYYYIINEYTIESILYS